MTADSYASTLFPYLSLALGLALGSFYSVCALRFIRGESIIRPRSHCPDCGRTLGIAELVPVLGWLLLRGRCAGCGKPVSILYPALEIASGLWAWLLALRFGPGAEWAVYMAFGGVFLVLSVIDLRTMLLPDAITLPTTALALIASGFLLPVGFRDALWGALAGGGLFLGLKLGYRLLRGREGLGMGDVKLMLLIGGLTGWQSLPVVLLVSSLGSLPWAVWLHLRAAKNDPPPQVPFGPFLCLGAMAAILTGPVVF